MRSVLVLVFALVGCISAGDDDVPFDAPVDGFGDAPIPDAPIDGAPFQCNNDSSIEPNDDIQSAFITPVSSAALTYSLVGLSICPLGDRDHYRFDIDTNGINFEASVTGTAGRPSLELAVLNASGTLVASGAPDNPAHVVRIELANRLAVGTYFVRVQSPNNTENNYDLSLKVCQTPLPCP